MGPLNELSPASVSGNKKDVETLSKFFGGNPGPTGASSRVLLSTRKALNPSVIVALHFSVSALDSLLVSYFAFGRRRRGAACSLNMVPFLTPAWDP